MFCDGRSRQVVFLAHCLLNQNAISDGTAVYPAAFQGLVRALLDRDIGIVQMPCPELGCLGLDRGDIRGAERPVTEENTRIRAALKQPEAEEALLRLARQVAWQILEYRRWGFAVLGIIGVNRSPSCGAETTSDRNAEVPGKGLLLEKLLELLAAEGAAVPVTGVRAGEEPETVLSRLGNVRNEEQKE